MDWGMVSLIVVANAVTTGAILAGGLWLFKKHIARETAAEALADLGPSVMMEAPPPVVEADHPVRQRRREASVRRDPDLGAAEPRPANRRRGLKDHLASLGGVPGNISDAQEMAVRELLGRSAPIDWMSGVQADALLIARDYAAAALVRSEGTSGHKKRLRRLTLTIVADDKARDFVTGWVEGAYSSAEGNLEPNPLEAEIWEWVQRHAARIQEAERDQVQAA